MYRWYVLQRFVGEPRIIKSNIREIEKICDACRESLKEAWRVKTVIRVLVWIALLLFRTAYCLADESDRKD
jgi:hypothetical protein